jgi:hypothetical protein
MKTIPICDPALCCSTGVCDAEIAAFDEFTALPHMEEPSS